MKLLAMLSAGLVATAVLTATPAVADRGHGHGWKWRTVCKTAWHHGHKTRMCHKQRYRW